MIKSARTAVALWMLLLATGCGRVDNASQAANGVAQATRQAGNAVANTVQRAGQAADQVGQAMGDQAAATFREDRDIASNLVRSGYASRAIAFVMGDVAYIAMQAPAAGVSGQRTKEQVSAHVKSDFPAIRQVYVSEDPNVYARFVNFQRMMQQGHPIQGVWQNFKTSVARMFPS
ncbi:YhcN/YlaJ family sporulation lipoprotein [Alicyclobacillus mali]|uniref:YhcN/YlaJ family sporulation lipoprotein n=1 Tax=Alicyclobacillus mali (ex Roth et al. 2021) TaxID=1123961 RepID=A0ABS0F5U1_9BACL|nr:YhcN/YlaJ family sporulation lipoprotein [Alicyclobacillus mali (ex Roth et al. 2021)]MBF8378659.1 YhcN/YlaJ family sporulation lipoprotein [Alicyclobacillus mali (ex Roth et al. 2021)]MCL6487474.1 YhcN/YlaJ family sporulation lipoprotein [Alicyclobacillus mali (ex Roth et al. 2021)]